MFEKALEMALFCGYLGLAVIQDGDRFKVCGVCRPTGRLRFEVVGETIDGALALFYEKMKVKPGPFAGDDEKTRLPS